MTELLYRVRPSHPGAHLFEVTLEIAAPDPEGQVVAIPAWIPGSYMIREFAKNVVRLTAQCDGHPLAVTKLDKQTWRCAPCAGPLHLRYEVYAWDLSVRSAHLDTTHAYFNGSSLFLQVRGCERAPATVEIVQPEGAVYADWRVATTLPTAGAPPWGFGRYQARDYEELIDHPVEMGRFTLLEFHAAGVPHFVAVSGRHQLDGPRLIEDLRRICEQQIALFGAPPPFDRYLFQVLAVGEGYGGLEHRSSTSLICSRNDLPRAGMKRMSEGYRTFLGLCSHEYFHSWHVKRIQPAVFQPYDLTREVYTTLLWVFEGFTSYYDDLTLVRAGLIDTPAYLELLGQNITRVLRGSGRLKQSVTESSFDAWTKFYKQDENSPNAVVSYYAKGAMLALALDLLLRSDDSGRTLDDLMRTLWQRHGSVGIDEAGFRALVAEVAGRDLDPFFSRYVDGTEEPPLADLLARFGIDYRLRAAESAADKGGKGASKPEAELLARPVLGARTGEDPLGAKLLNVFDGGPAQAAGLSAGDLLVAIDGLRATHGNLEGLLAGRGPGDRVEIHLFRRDELLDFELTLGTPPEDTCYLALAGAADAEMLARLRAWLGDEPPAAP